jgi:hypothetical protein
MIVPVDNNAENTGLGGNENKLTLTTLRAAQISNMHARLSNAFAADVEAMSDANINDREDDEALSPTARVKYLSLIEKISKVNCMVITTNTSGSGGSGSGSNASAGIGSSIIGKTLGNSSGSQLDLHIIRLDIYPYLTELYLEYVPPSTIKYFHVLRDRLVKLEIVNSGISDLRKILCGGGGNGNGSDHNINTDTGTGISIDIDRDRDITISNSTLSKVFFPMVLPQDEDDEEFDTESDVSPRSPRSPRSTATGASTSGSTSSEPTTPTRTRTQARTQARTQEQEQEQAQMSGNTITSHTAKIEILNRYSWKYLQYLRLNNCGLVRIDPTLHLLPKLVTLDLSNNDIQHIVHLHDCHSLKTLNMSYNRVRVLSNLERVLGNVQDIDLSHNLITNMDGIQKIYSLLNLNLSYNLIDDISEVSKI